MSKKPSRRPIFSPANLESGVKTRVRPNKQFGQHFLTDPNILARIVNAGEVGPGDLILEIGPGRGSLTHALLTAGAEVVAVEIDSDLAERLRAENLPNLTVFHGDFMTAPPGDWLERAGFSPTSYRVVANLPYYITSAILRRLLESSRQPQLAVVMVQREVAQQLAAQAGHMNLLAVSIQFYGVPHIVGLVPAGAFFPRPQVDSAIVRIDVSSPSRFPSVDSEKFFRIVRAGFAERRKQIHNSLAHGLSTSAVEVGTALARAGIDPKRRAETLTLEEWVELERQFGPLGVTSNLL